MIANDDLTFFYGIKTKWGKIMKCWKCGSEIPENAMHCTQCGALVKPTHKLMQAVNAGDQDAITQLYCMCYGVIYNELGAIGLEKQQSADLVNKVFKSFIERAQNIPVEELLTTLMGLTDHIGFTYMKEHALEPHTVSTDEHIKVTKKMIDEMFICLHEQEEKKKKPHKKHMKVILVSVLVIALAVTGAFMGINMHHQKVAKLQKQTYLAVTKEYVEAVNKLSVDRSLLKKENKLKQRYPQTYKAASIVIKHKRSLSDLQCVMHDVDGDGNKELLIGYKDSNDQFVIAGIYRNKNGDEQATNTNAISKVTEKLILTKNHKVIKEADGSYKLLKLNKMDHYYVVKGISDFAKYLKKHNTKKLALKAVSANTFYKKETKGKTLTAYKYLPADDKMQKWLDAYQDQQYNKCNTIAASMPKESEEIGASSMPKQMKNAYKKVVKAYAKKYLGHSDIGYLSGYYLVDMDGDGEMELLMDYSGSDYITYLDVYKFKNGTAQEVIKGYDYSQADGRIRLYAYSGHPGIIALYQHNSMEGVEVYFLSGHKINIKDYGGRDLHDGNNTTGEYVNLGNQLNNHMNEDYPEIDYSILE